MADPHSMDLGRTVAEAAQGDKTAFGRLVAETERKLYSVIRGLLNNHDDAMDVLQTTFLKAYRSLNQFRGQSSVQTWLTCIAMNESRRALSRRQKRNASSVDERFLESVENRTEVANSSHQEISVEIRRAIDQLPASLREVVILLDIEEYSYEEAGEVLGLSRGALWTRASRAHAKLRELLAGSIED